MSEVVIHVEVPFPPSVNTVWRKWHGRMVLSDKARAYREKVRTELLWQKAVPSSPLNGPLAIHVELHPPDRRRRDCDNALKALSDSLQHAGLFADDSQIVWLLVEKAQIVSGGKAVVRIVPRGSGSTSDLILRLFNPN